MKKNFLTKTLALMLCAFTAIPMAGCQEENVGVGGEAIDANKTQLNVWHYFAGFRDEWLVELKDNFEKAFANVSFEDGKMGVQVHHRGEMKADWTASSMADSPYEVFFMEGPQNYLGIMAEGGVESLNSIMTTENADDNNQTIEGKMTKQQKDFYNYTYCPPNLILLSAVYLLLYLLKNGFQFFSSDQKIGNELFGVL